MTEHVSDQARVAQAIHERCGHGVPSVVKPDRWQARTSQRSVPGFQNDRGAQRTAICAADDKAVELVRTADPQRGLGLGHTVAHNAVNECP
jgi:hypothetical protein